MIRVSVCGACGRMGQRIAETVSRQEDMEIVSAIDRAEAPELGIDIGELVGVGNLGVEVTGSDSIKETLEESNPDVLVDFTVAEAAVENIRAAAEKDIPVVVGTTGFSKEQRSEMENAIQSAEISAIVASNMSIGVNVFFRLIEETAEKLDDYDMELLEAHHNKKRDAPSGTALTAAKIAAEASGRDFEEVAKFGREKGDLGERAKDEIGIHSIRAGNISGDHKFLFAGPNERLELVHRAQSRQAFADGAIRAIRYVVEEGEPGKIEDMQDVLFE